LSAAFIYSDQWATYVYGPHHPLKPIRLHLTYELMKAYGLLESPARIIPAVAASTDDLLRFHTPEYLQILEAVSEGVAMPTMSCYGLGPGDNPIFSGLRRFSTLAVGASLLRELSLPWALAWAIMNDRLLPNDLRRFTSNLPGTSGILITQDSSCAMLPTIVSRPIMNGRGKRRNALWVTCRSMSSLSSGGPQPQRL
jgi:hypothetical protein